MSETKPQYPTDEDLHNSAWHYIQNHYRKLFKGRVYGPSVLDCIRVAPSADDLKAFLEKVWPGASSGTRRKWAKAAELRYRELDKPYHLIVGDDDAILRVEEGGEIPPRWKDAVEIPAVSYYPSYYQDMAGWWGFNVSRPSPEESPERKLAGETEARAWLLSEVKRLDAR